MCVCCLFTRCRVLSVSCFFFQITQFFLGHVGVCFSFEMHSVYAFVRTSLHLYRIAHKITLGDLSRFASWPAQPIMMTYLSVSCDSFSLVSSSISLILILFNHRKRATPIFFCMQYFSMDILHLVARSTEVHV